MPRAQVEFISADIEVIQVAEMRPLRRIDEMTGQLPFDVKGELAIRGEGVIPKISTDSAMAQSFLLWSQF